MPPLRTTSATVLRSFVVLSQCAYRYFHNISNEDSHRLVAREKFDPNSTADIVFACLIPVLVLLSGLFAGLTLGYMSLDQTQLSVLALSGTPEQRKYANQIMPIRKNGHLLLVTLLLANMIVNESLPIFADKVLGGPVQSVVISTVLIVIFSEIIPQALFTRHGLYLGAKGAGLTMCLIYAMGIVSYPVAKLLDFILGSNHGIIYRRAELKELIAMHSSLSAHGGDLKSDTVTIIGATLDLQEKVVRQAMTPISDVFMLSIDSKLDYALLKKIVDSGHSRIPVYEEVDVPDTARAAGIIARDATKVNKIIGIFLVKQCVLLDPKDATPLRQLQLNRVPFVPNNESLLGILDKFQQGGSHMAIVSRVSREKAKSVKQAVKRGLTQRLRDRVGMGDSSGSDSESDDDEKTKKSGDDTIKEKDFANEKKRGRGAKKTDEDVEAGIVKDTGLSFQISTLEQSMPADAVLTKESANEFLQGLDPAVMPLGIITLEDVLEELIGEEIYDEFDADGAHGEPVHPHHAASPPAPAALAVSETPVNKSLAGMKNLSFFRSRSAPPKNRQEPLAKAASTSDLPAGSEATDVVNVVEAGEAKPPVVTVTNDDSNLDASTNPALEAVLLDRKRRLLTATASSPIIVGTSRTRAGPKGKFKSSPIDTLGAAKAVGPGAGPPTEVFGDDLEAELRTNGNKVATEDTKTADT
ncbi:hypothetical protein C8J56DRAFT_855249 [Mycena floridula]|nr:hypothetical protein C8J56DRAFT_855249 [Mycena floridula]